MKIRFTVSILAFCATACMGFGQVILSGSSYTENFNNIGSVSPAGWTFYTDATTSGLGTVQIYTSDKVTWGSGNISQFRNVAATTGLVAGDKQPAQDGSADRAMGLRQGNTEFGDPGAAFVFNFDATGVTNVSVSLDAMVQKVKSRSETWTLDYSLDGGSSWVAITTWSDPGTFGSTAVASSGPIAALDNYASALIRFVGLSSTGTGVLDAIAIDNFTLSYTSVPATSSVPEPATFGLLAGLGGIGLALIRRRRRVAIS